MLLRKENFSHIGAFRVPAALGPSMNFGSTSTQGMAFNPANQSLFCVGTWQGIAELAIPALVESPNLGDLATTTVIQPFTDVLSQLPNPLVGADDGTRVGGLLPYNGRLIGTAYAYYSGANGQTTTYFTLDSLDLAHAAVGGLYQAGDGSLARKLAGYVAQVPPEWQGPLGMPVISGGADIPIIGTCSSGPAALGFDPASLPGTPPVSPYLFYPETIPLGAYQDTYGPQQNGTTVIGGAFFVPGTDSFLVVGSSGIGYCGYGVPGIYDDWAYQTKGPHVNDDKRAFQVWAYDVNDFVAVRNGTKLPWEVQPYDIWNFSLPFYSAWPWTFWVQGATFDPASGKLYLAVSDDDKQAGGSLPIFHALQLNTNAPLPNTPHIGTLASWDAAATLDYPLPDPITIGHTARLMAGNVYAQSGTTITGVQFFLGTQLLGNGSPSTQTNGGHNWILDIPTTGLTAGVNTITAVATQSDGLQSDPITGSLTLQ